MADMNMRELYTIHSAFRAYVDKHCRTYNLTLDQALDHSLVKAVADQYIHPDDTYTFGNVGPLSPLTNADRIRAMSDEDLADLLNHAESEGYKDSSITPILEDGYHMDMLEWLKQEARNDR